MVKRLCILALVLACLAPSASADGVPLSTDVLPPCYRYPICGANVVYADAPVAVYSAPSAGAEIIGTVYPCQSIQLEEIDWPSRMAYVIYNEPPQDHSWNIDDFSKRGWIETRFTTFYSDYDAMWVVTTDQPGNRLNLRTGPAADKPSLGKYYAGTVVWQQEKAKNGYMKVMIGQMIGYMDTDFLAPGLYTPDAELPPLTVTRASGITLRKLPQNDSEIIKTAPHGATVTALAVRSDGWVQIVYENEIGYTRGDGMTPELDY